MKKIVFSLFWAALSAMGPGLGCFAQDETPAKLRLYGFIRNYLVYDTRAVDAGTQDLYFYMPKDRSLQEDGTDLNAAPSFRMLALTSRLGLDISGYRIGDTQVSGIIEGDFYCMSGSTAAFRLRQAYASILWDNMVLGDLTLNVGQTWHPMAADLPHVTNLETGAPFNPFNRSPQIMAHWSVGNFTWTGGILYPMQYLPVGPSSTTGPSWDVWRKEYSPQTTYATVKSAAFVKNGLIPEVYLGVSYSRGGFLGKAGVNLFSIRPGWEAPAITVIDAATRELTYDYDTRSVIRERLFAVSPFVYLQYSSGSFQIRAKSILAQAGEHMNLLSGYGATFDWKRQRMAYTPMRDWASFVSFQVGRRIRFMTMLGYMQQLGTTKSLFNYELSDFRNSIWLNTSADSHIQRAFRATPTLAYNLGKLTFSIEYNCTGAWFGEGRRNIGGLYTAGHWVLNHRIQQMVRFSF